LLCSLLLGLGLGLSAPAVADTQENMAAAVDALRARQFEQAVELFSQILQQDDLSAGDRLRALRGRGHAYHELRRFKLAVADYSRSIDLRPGLADLWNSRCWSRIYIDQPRAAIEDCDVALKLDPKFGAAYDSRAMAYSGAGDYDKALEDHKRALERARIAEHLYNRGITQERRGDRVAAQSDFSEARKLATDQEHWSRIVHEMEPLRPGEGPSLAPPQQRATPPSDRAAPEPESRKK